MFIALEGIDGAGKTTTAELVAAALSSRGVEAEALIRTAPRGCHPYVAAHLAGLRRCIWELSRNAPIHLLGELHWMHLHAAYLAALAEHVVGPALDRGAVVVADGWLGKLTARLVTNGNRSLDETTAFFAGIRQPDLVAFLDTPPETAARRRGDFSDGERGALGAAERSFITYQHQVRDVLTRLARRNGWWRVEPGAATAEALAGTVADEAERRLPALPANTTRGAP